jgi:phytoene dehydrogenase-like protein
MSKKKIAIIGAGISGLSAGIHARLHGFEAELYEAHHSVGGECTAWRREGYNIDGCIHWLTGTKPGSSVRAIWETCGALSPETGIVNHERITSYMDEQGKIYHLYSDVRRMEDELLRISPEDEQEIRRLIRIVKKFQRLEIPVEKPEEMMNLWDKLKLMVQYIPCGKFLQFGMKQSMSDYIKRFRSPVVRGLLSGVAPDVYAAHALFFTIACRIKGDGGWPLGGSFRLAQRMQQRFEALGGRLFLSSNVEKIVIENGRATGIKLRSEKDTRAFDYVVSAIDIHALLHDLLEKKYADPYFEQRFAAPEKYPTISCTLVSIGVETALGHRPHNLTLHPGKAITVGGAEQSSLMLTHYAYDPAFCSGERTTVEFFISDFGYDWWDALRKESEHAYQSEKKRVGDLLLSELQQVYPETAGKAHVIDVATPLTFNRYCNAYKGAYMSFVSAAGAASGNHKGVIDGVDRLYLAGQWVFPGGGLPPALLAGKFAVQRICRQEKSPRTPSQPRRLQARFQKKSPDDAGRAADTKVDRGGAG